MTQTRFPKVGVSVFLRRLTHDHVSQILLLKRKGSHGAGTWALPGGHIDWRENALTCAAREVEEEIGITVGKMAFIGISEGYFEKEDKHYITLVFQAVWDREQTPKIMEPDKIEELKWFPKDDLPEPLFLPLANFLDDTRGWQVSPIAWRSVEEQPPLDE